MTVLVMSLLAPMKTDPVEAKCISKTYGVILNSSHQKSCTFEDLNESKIK